jgi:hypothetical protein
VVHQPMPATATSAARKPIRVRVVISLLLATD